MKKSNKLKVNLTKKLVKTIQTENVGTAMYQTGQEVILAIEEILQKKFNFSEADLQVLEKELMKMLSTLAALEREGFSILSPKDMEIVIDIAQTRFNRLKEGIQTKRLPDKTTMKFLTVMAKKKPRKGIN